jgi:hypothetical protein
MKMRMLFALSLLAGTLAAQLAQAAPVTIEGITFSDEKGDFTILKVTGTGTLQDPFVVVEDVTGDTPILVIRGMNIGFGNRVGSQHVIGFAIAKICINHTGSSWTQYRMELRTTPTDPSPYGDGLSFAQGFLGGPPASSSGFHHARVIDEPFDAIDFTDGQIKPGESVSFDFLITDMTPKSEVFLLQQPVKPVSCNCGRLRLAAR